MRIVTAVTLTAALLVPTVGAIASQTGHQDTAVSAGSAGVPGTGEDDDTPWG